MLIDPELLTRNERNGAVEPAATDPATVTVTVSDTVVPVTPVQVITYVLVTMDAVVFEATLADSEPPPEDLDPVHALDAVHAALERFAVTHERATVPPEEPSDAESAPLTLRSTLGVVAERLRVALVQLTHPRFTPPHAYPVRLLTDAEGLNETPYAAVDEALALRILMHPSHPPSVDMVADGVPEITRAHPET